MAERKLAEQDDVPHRLIDTAIRLYGEKGTQGVSLREITRQAGVLNESAVRYYFGNKQGLLDAVMCSIRDELEPMQKPELARLQMEMDKGRLDVASVMTGFSAPLLSLHVRDPARVKLMARMIREEGSAGQDLLLKHFGPVIWVTESFLRKLLPDKDPDILRLHFFLAINNLLNGLCDMSLLWRLPAVEDPEGHFHLSEGDLIRHFMAYLVAGVSTGQSDS